jgi:hypothetical protein
VGLSFTIAAGRCQRSHFRVRVPRDSWPYFTVSDSRPPNLEGQVPIFIFPGTGWPSYSPGTGFPFRRLLRLTGLRWMYSNPPPHCSANCLQDNSSAWTTQKIKPLYCCRCVFTTSLHSNGGGADHIDNIALLLSRACMLRASPSNGRCLSHHCSATGLHATLCKGAITLQCLWLWTSLANKYYFPSLEIFSGIIWKMILCNSSIFFTNKRKDIYLPVCERFAVQTRQ